jgi:hypothetical protein
MQDEKNGSWSNKKLKYSERISASEPGIYFKS